MGYKVFYNDGYGQYPVVGLCIDESRMMQVTSSKNGFVICDVVEWRHPLIVVPY